MAVKTITIDIEAYRRLKQVKQEGESFSQVIKRKVRPDFNLDAWLKRLREAPLDKGFMRAVEEQVAGRSRRSRGQI